jgi:hypothetical protein
MCPDIFIILHSNHFPIPPIQRGLNTDNQSKSRLPTTFSHRQSLPPNSSSSPLIRPSHYPNDPGALSLRDVDGPLQHRRIRNPSQSQSQSPTQHFQTLTRDRASGVAPLGDGRVRGLESSLGTDGSYLPNLGLTSSHVGSSPLPPDHSVIALDQNGKPGTPRADGTESTASTNAPSTVWDVLDDLKSRMRNLELGKLSATSGQAMSNVSGDRPWTANTTVTTLSSSPQRGRGNSISPSSSAVPGNPGIANVHPLLHAALSRTKDLINPDIYKALEAAASDALSIAAVMGSASQYSGISVAHSVIGSGGLGSLASDRQLRRKADSMCRSLTELCLALSENRTEPSSSMDSHIQPYHSPRPASRDRPMGNRLEARSDSMMQIRHRGSSQEPESLGGISGLGRPSPRTASRLEARRSSMYGLNGPGNASNDNSPRGQETATPTQPSAPPNPSRLGRTSTVLLRNRRGDLDDHDDHDGNFRAPSRATTDIGYRSQREYTSQQPLPDRSSPSSQSGLPVRRHHISASVSSSSTPPFPSNLSYSSNSNNSSQSLARSRLLDHRPNTLHFTTSAHESNNNNNDNNNNGNIQGKGERVQEPSEKPHTTSFPRAIPRQFPQPQVAGSGGRVVSTREGRYGR